MNFRHHRAFSHSITSLGAEAMSPGAFSKGSWTSGHSNPNSRISSPVPAGEGPDRVSISIDVPLLAYSRKYATDEVYSYQYTGTQTVKLLSCPRPLINDDSIDVLQRLYHRAYSRTACLLLITESTGLVASFRPRDRGRPKQTHLDKSEDATCTKQRFASDEDSENQETIGVEFKSWIVSFECEEGRRHYSAMDLIPSHGINFPTEIDESQAGNFCENWYRLISSASKLNRYLRIQDEEITHVYSLRERLWFADYGREYDSEDEEDETEDMSSQAVHIEPFEPHSSWHSGTNNLQAHNQHEPSHCPAQTQLPLESNVALEAFLRLDSSSRAKKGPGEATIPEINQGRNVPSTFVPDINPPLLPSNRLQDPIAKAFETQDLDPFADFDKRNLMPRSVSLDALADYVDGWDGASCCSSMVSSPGCLSPIERFRMNSPTNEKGRHFRRSGPPTTMLQSAVEEVVSSSSPNSSMEGFRVNSPCSEKTRFAKRHGPLLQSSFEPASCSETESPGALSVASTQRGSDLTFRATKGTLPRNSSWPLLSNVSFPDDGVKRFPSFSWEELLPYQTN
mmetsp:Transcript_5099/g.8196  ORF Transcript_5099/g.8196 Transcript_5099/m.8196 type:complete len:567 (+) Transcript_5099:388-2088(+)